MEPGLGIGFALPTRRYFCTRPSSRLKVTMLPKATVSVDAGAGTTEPFKPLRKSRRSSVPTIRRSHPWVMGTKPREAIYSSAIRAGLLQFICQSELSAEAPNEADYRLLRWDLECG
jgi:hypothetical protein